MFACAERRLTYLTQDEIVDRLISDMAAQIGLTDDPSAYRELIHRHWLNAQVFPDAYTFFDQCSVPIYIITNIGLPYMEQALLHKPRWEIFDEALRASGCTPGEVVHIGDTYGTDVVGARGAGIRPVLTCTAAWRCGYHR